MDEDLSNDSFEFGNCSTASRDSGDANVLKELLGSENKVMRRPKKYYPQFSAFDPEDDEQYDKNDFHYNKFYDLEVGARKRRMKMRHCYMNEYGAYWSQIYEEFINFLLHSLLYVRCFYPPRAFHCSKYLQLPVRECKIPDVALNIKQTAREARRLFNKNRRTRITLKMMDHSGNVWETYRMDTQPFAVDHVPKAPKILKQRIREVEEALKNTMLDVLKETRKYEEKEVALKHELTGEELIESFDEVWEMDNGMVPISTIQCLFFRFEMMKLVPR